MLEERVAKIEGVLEQMDKRLGSIESRMNHLEARMDKNFGWTIGMLVTMWVTIIIAIILK